jgi:hypothetical protein
MIDEHHGYTSPKQENDMYLLVCFAYLKAFQAGR